MYTHISRDDRAIIADGRRRGESYQEIADRIGRDKGAVWREVNRNRDPDGVYRSVSADRKARERRKHSKTAFRKIENDQSLTRRIEEMLDPLSSPETVAHDVGVAHQTIYNWVNRSRPDLKKKLPYQGKKRRKYGSKRSKKQGWTRHVRSIHERPKEAETREEPGHFEGDTLRGKNGALLTHTDRKSRFEIVHKMPNETADAAHAAVVRDKHLLKAKTITYDRGSSFALWEMIERGAALSVFFADPHAPWQRGTNENTNGRLRRVFPKGCDFSKVTEQDIDRVVWKMNHTKRKCLLWRTPCEVYGGCCSSD